MRHPVLERDISPFETHPQDALEYIANGFIDQSAWFIIMVDGGVEVARIGSIIQLESIATLTSVMYPELTVQIMKHGLTRKSYRDGRLVKDQVDIREIIPDATDSMVEDWKNLK